MKSEKLKIMCGTMLGLESIIMLVETSILERSKTISPVDNEHWYMLIEIDIFEDL